MDLDVSLYESQCLVGPMYVRQLRSSEIVTPSFLQKIHLPGLYYAVCA